MYVCVCVCRCPELVAELQERLGGDSNDSDRQLPVASSHPLISSSVQSVSEVQYSTAQCVCVTVNMCVSMHHWVVTSTV